jgi:NAD(P)-dependent dehydrogenase (short-subunit alcohol dehydrogenase family)
MANDPLQALQAANRVPPRAAAKPTLVIAGAGGALGNEIVRRLVGTQGFGATHVLVREPLQSGLRGVEALVVPSTDTGQWPLQRADVGLVMFDPPRNYYNRERALVTPAPADLVAVAQWMHACGVRTLAVVMPHLQGRLPEAVKRGLANLDEQAVAGLGFERFLLLRSAQKPSEAKAARLPERVAAWMLSVFKFMVPPSEQPVRAAKVAELLDVALRSAPAGIHIAAPELMWRASQGDVAAVAAQWLHGASALAPAQTTAKSVLSSSRT